MDNPSVDGHQWTDINGRTAPVSRDDARRCVTLRSPHPTLPCREAPPPTDAPCRFTDTRVTDQTQRAYAPVYATPHLPSCRLHWAGSHATRCPDGPRSHLCNLSGCRCWHACRYQASVVFIYRLRHACGDRSHAVKLDAEASMEPYDSGRLSATPRNRTPLTASRSGTQALRQLGA